MREPRGEESKVPESIVIGGARALALRIVLVCSVLPLACERSRGPAATPVASSTDSKSGEAIAFRLVDVARELGLDAAHRSGRDPAGEAPLLHHTMGGGIAWLDFDLDGDFDLFLSSGDRETDELAGASDSGGSRLYRYDAGRFVDVTESAGLGSIGYALGAAVGDIDNDGDPDLYVSCHGPNRLLRNRGDGTFELLRDVAEIPSTPFTAGAAFADFDGDGLVDLFVASYVDEMGAPPPPCYETRPDGSRVRVLCGPLSYRGAGDHVLRNRGEGRFEDVSERSGIGIGADRGSKSLGVIAADLDADGDVDVFVACDTTANLLYRNRGDGVFDEVGLEAGVAASGSGAYEGGMGIALADLDEDGLPDLFVTNFAEEPNRIYLSAGGGAYEDATARLGVGPPSRALVGWGAAFIDLDRDGREELLVANGHIYENIAEWHPERTYAQRCLLHARAVGSERFVDGSDSLAPGEARVYRGLATADFDGDGGIDIALSALDARPALLRSQPSEEGDRRAHYVLVRLVGRGPGGRDAVGARVTLRTRTQTLRRWRVAGGSYLSESAPSLHFGLGTSERIESLTVDWPGGGRATTLQNLPVDREIEVRR